MVKEESDRVSQYYQLQRRERQEPIQTRSQQLAESEIGVFGTSPRHADRVHSFSAQLRWLLERSWSRCLQYKRAACLHTNLDNTPAYCRSTSLGKGWGSFRQRHFRLPMLSRGQRLSGRKSLHTVCQSFSLAPVETWKYRSFIGLVMSRNYNRILVLMSHASHQQAPWQQPRTQRSRAGADIVQTRLDDRHAKMSGKIPLATF